MLVQPITYNNINSKGYAQDIKNLRIFDSDHRLLLLEKGKIRGIEKAKNSKLVDELFKVFKGYLGCDIYRAYYAILDSNDEVNNYAKNTLYAIASGRSTNFITNIKNITKMGSQSINYGLDHVADLIQACKDDKGNHNKKALDLLGELETETLATGKIPSYIEFCKDKDGQIDDEKVKLFKEFLAKKYHIYSGMLAQLPLENTREITQTRLDFFNHVMEKYYKNELTAGGVSLAQEILKGTRDSKDASISWIDSRFDELLNDDGTVRWGAEYLTCKDGKIDLETVDTLIAHIIPELKERGEKGTISADILKAKDRLSFINFKKYLRLYDTLNQNKDLISELSKLNEFKTEDEIIDNRFVDFVIKNDFYIRKTHFLQYPADMLKEVLRISKNDDGTTNWDIANDIIKPIYLLFKKKGQELHKLGIKPENNKNNFYHDTFKYCSLLEKSIKEENGKFSKERIKELSNIAGKDIDSLIRVLAGEPLEKMVEGKNLYKADELLEILKELKNTERLNADTLKASIKDYGSLFWAIIEAPRTEENKETYSKVMELFSKVRGLDYNQKDAHEISVLEKIINAENEELLNVLIDNSVKLNYYPELDWVYNGVQNQKFKEKLNSLNLKFKDLEQAAELCSVKILNRLKSQFESPFCDKEKVIRELFYIARIQKGKEPLAFVYHLLEEYGEYLHRDLFNEMATWQVSEKLKREI